MNSLAVGMMCLALKAEWADPTNWSTLNNTERFAAVTVTPQRFGDAHVGANRCALTLCDTKEPNSTTLSTHIEVVSGACTIGRQGARILADSQSQPFADPERWQVTLGPLAEHLGNNIVFVDVALGISISFSPSAVSLPADFDALNEEQTLVMSGLSRRTDVLFGSFTRSDGGSGRWLQLGAFEIEGLALALRAMLDASLNLEGLNALFLSNTGVVAVLQNGDVIVRFLPSLDEMKFSLGPIEADSKEEILGLASRVGCFLLDASVTFGSELLFGAASASFEIESRDEESCEAHGG